MLSTEMTQDLMVTAPLFFRKTPGGYAHSFDERGFEVEAGWYYLLRYLGVRVQMVLEKVRPAEREAYRCTQVKQKWGRLEVYYEQGPDRVTRARIEEYLREAEKTASRTCETCRAPGHVLNIRGQVCVACFAHTSARIHGRPLTISPHNWKTVEVDGGSVGVGEFYECASCGGNGGPVLGRRVPSFPPFKDVLELSIDCEIAKAQIAGDRV